ncbi:hypothetical protein [Spirosoma endophyticum]|uniref:Uncharacterized protein n=1 Tax=Spirosoma endophyticum TaxID=662367 RepID=A0A1I2FCJ5_9BACT|nr:hypothetical protein [Spirosoma endophyticum]SFF02619.1 hypothetical protein SAMN05216167_12531 [Spirosoma endophyticum]
MKRTASTNFFVLILGIALLASLGVNIYQLYSRSAFWPPDGEVVDREAESTQLLQQLSSCSQENTRKDSLIAVLKQRSAITTYSTLSSQQGP